MKRHIVILEDRKLDAPWWAHTKFAILFSVMAVVIFGIYAFVL